MKKILYLSLSLAALSLASAVWWFVVRLDSHLAAANQSLSDSADLLDARMETESARYAGLLKAQSAAWRTLAGQQATAYRASLERESAALRGQIVWAQLMEVRPVRDAAVQALASVPPAVSDARKLIGASEGLVTKATPQIIGLAAGWKQAGGFSAQTLRMVQPDIKTVTSEAAKAAPDARSVVANVKAITKPPSLLMKVIGFFGKLFF